MAIGLRRLFDRLPTDSVSRRHRLVVSAALVLCAVAVPARWLHPRGVLLGIPTTYLLRDQATQWAEMHRERDGFNEEMASSKDRYDSMPGLLSGLEGRDVILAFIESYGMSAVDDPRYAPVIRPKLRQLESDAREAGVAIVTGTLEAPSQGGMSWLGHGSVLSGLWLENQLRYDLLLASDRGTMVDDFEAAGYRTVAVMPAITMAWPEGVRFGYEEIYDHERIEYAGPPLNWVTMPDQFTWSFLERTVRTRQPDRPLFAELGLISSHAPWTPILPVLDDWGGIGDGSVFEPWADAGERPEDLWRDGDRVREAYAMSVGYAVDVLASYAAEFVDDGSLLIALGDHQPAPLITGDDATRAVPVHVMATDSRLLEPFRAWGFVDGALPVPGAVPRPMSDFRDWFVTAFSTERPDT
jgi:hypothetical protein